MNKQFETDLERDVWREKREQQKNQDDYWGECILKINEVENDKG